MFHIQVDFLLVVLRHKTQGSISVIFTATIHQEDECSTNLLCKKRFK